MAVHPFRIVNVFTTSPVSAEGAQLSGNPLCVFEDAQGLDTATMQALARQFNLSETTFLLPSAQAAARVRIFTPSYEMPFAGHPTLGSAHVCRALGRGGDSLTLEMQAGLIAVQAKAQRWTLTAPRASWREFDAPVSELAAALGLEAQDIGERPLWVKTGKEQLVVPVTSTAAVQRAAPNVERFDRIRSEDGHSMAYLFAFDDPGRTLARFFFPQGSAILEDPATGSATANFGGWCLAMQRALPVDFSIAQGEQTGRPSSLYLQVGERGEIYVGGDVLELGRGTISL